jgi:hypothetical protein
MHAENSRNDHASVRPERSRHEQVDRACRNERGEDRHEQARVARARVLRHQRDFGDAAAPLLEPVEDRLARLEALPAALAIPLLHRHAVDREHALSALDALRRALRVGGAHDH